MLERDIFLLSREPSTALWHLADYDNEDCYYYSQEEWEIRSRTKKRGRIENNVKSSKTPPLYVWCLKKKDKKIS